MKNLVLSLAGVIVVGLGIIGIQSTVLVTATVVACVTIQQVLKKEEKSFSL
jgi:uncharacterized membrane protein YbaN (DUF454 family)